jgi:DNA-binding MarR family transcriptional regulator
VPARPSDLPPFSPVPELAHRLSYLFKHAQLRLAELTGAALAPLGITGRELAVLLVISEEPPASQLQIGTRMGVDRTTMVALIDELERKGLVERRPDDVDRRRNVTALTTLGRTTARQAASAAEKAERRFLEPLALTDAAVVRRALRRLAFPEDLPPSAPTASDRR